MKGFGLISNSSFLTIQDLVEDMLTEDIMDLVEHKNFNLAEWIDDHFVKFKKIFDKMYPSYRKKLWRFVVDKFVMLFCQYLLFNTLKYSPDELNQFLEKIEEEREIIFDVFSSVIAEKDVEDRITSMDLLIKSLKKPVDEVVVLVVNLRIAMKQKNFNTKCIKCILRMRKDITREEKIAMLQLIENQASTIKKIERRDIGRLFKKTIMTDYYVRRFCSKFKMRYEKKKEAMRKKKQQKLDHDLLRINANERLEIEEELFSLRGFLGVTSVKFNDISKKMALIRDARKQKYSKMHFSFLDDIVIWKKKPTSKLPTEKIYLVNIDDIGVEGMNFLWFTREKTLFLIQCQSEPERRSWIKALIFLREESLSELKPLDFDQFCCVAGGTIYDEIFSCDVIDYEYDHIKIKQKKERVKKEFNMNNLDVGDQELKEQGEEVEERSIEELSWSSEPEEEESESSEEIPEDAELKDKAKIIAKNEIKKMKSAFHEF